MTDMLPSWLLATTTPFISATGRWGILSLFVPFVLLSFLCLPFSSFVFLLLSPVCFFPFFFFSSSSLSGNFSHSSCLSCSFFRSSFLPLSSVFFLRFSSSIPRLILSFLLFYLEFLSLSMSVLFVPFVLLSFPYLPFSSFVFLPLSPVCFLPFFFFSCLSGISLTLHVCLVCSFVLLSFPYFLFSSFALLPLSPSASFLFAFLSGISLTVHVCLVRFFRSSFLPLSSVFFFSFSSFISRLLLSFLSSLSGISLTLHVCLVRIFPSQILFSSFVFLPLSHVCFFRGFFFFGVCVCFFFFFSPLPRWLSTGVKL